MTRYWPNCMGVNSYVHFSEHKNRTLGILKGKTTCNYQSITIFYVLGRGHSQPVVHWDIAKTATDTEEE